MISFGGKPKGAPVERRAPPGKRCYAIGDIHGRLDLLNELIDKIGEHALAHPGPEIIVVTLGDVIDRGPDSKGVLERLMQPFSFRAKLVCLKGNHEDTLLRGLDGEPQRLKDWLEFGGWETAQSYGLDRSMLAGQPLEVIEHNVASAIPPAHVRFMSNFADSARFGDYLLVHAGIRPETPLAEQSPYDLKWIRQPFLDSKLEHGVMVVHGHSVSARVETRPNRIGVDTGAWKTGVLTAVWIEDGRTGFLEARDGSAPPPNRAIA